MKKYWCITIIATELLLGCSNPSLQQSSEKVSSTQATLSLKGALVAKGIWNTPPGQPCKILDVENVLKGKDADLNKVIQRDLKVTVKNAKNEIVALGQLGEAQAIKAKDESFSWCAFPIDVTGIPLSDFYTISIGKLEQSFQKTEIEQGESYLYTDHAAIKSMISY